MVHAFVFADVRRREETDARATGCAHKGLQLPRSIATSTPVSLLQVAGHQLGSLLSSASLSSVAAAVASAPHSFLAARSGLVTEPLAGPTGSAEALAALFAARECRVVSVGSATVGASSLMSREEYAQVPAAESEVSVWEGWVGCKSVWRG